MDLKILLFYSMFLQIINSIKNSITIGLAAATVKPVHQEKGPLKIGTPKDPPNSSISIKKAYLLIVGRKMEEALR
jgi:hypothetical protein